MILFVGQYGDDSVDAQREGCLGNCTKIGGKFQSSEAGISINQLSGEKGKKKKGGTSLVVQCPRLHNPNARGLGSILGQGTRSHIPQLKTLNATTTIKDVAQSNK